MEMFDKGRDVSSSMYVRTAASSKVKKFYRRQNTEISGFDHCVKGRDSHVTSAEEHRLLRLSGICAAVTLVINIILVSLKVYSAITSNSSSVMASLVDNSMDVISNIILLIVNHKVKILEPYAYPHGKTRMEPIGVMLFAIIMTMTGLMMIMSAMEEIVNDVTGHEKITSNLRIFDMSLFIATSVMKMTCFIVMYRWKNQTIQALALDHLNDAMVNLVALAMAFVGRHVWRFADPMGALLIAIIIVFNWIRVIRQNVQQVVGHTAKPKWLRQLCWLIVQNVSDVARPAYLRASAFGETYLVDVGLVFNEGTQVKDAAKISQNLKMKLEESKDIAVAMVCIVDVNNIPEATSAESTIVLTTEETTSPDGVVNLAM